MKRFFAMMMALLMTVSCLVISVGASEVKDANTENSSTVEPKQILTYTKVHRAYVGSSAVDITVRFTARDDAYNSSGYYITGILSASIKNVTGWHSVGSVTINRSGITYSDNYQYASIPVTYEASGGSGLRTYTTTISVSTYVDC